MLFTRLSKVYKRNKKDAKKKKKAEKVGETRFFK